ncbi:hypothetical protein A0H81_08977 [Grifola frondosa]|uniref:Uncharacterized protein n=1 Tax=Grifola frondosa TaxID=5627 RepID=A0A1C7M2P6_GRIFR|nr:hypothetical protein A0H81_08977 [Grifola frondosa]
MPHASRHAFDDTASPRRLPKSREEFRAMPSIEDIMYEVPGNMVVRTAPGVIIKFRAKIYADVVSEEVHVLRFAREKVPACSETHLSSPRPFQGWVWHICMEECTVHH